jgi:hypothetical protein
MTEPPSYDWVPLRDYFREQAEAGLDDIIRSEEDPRLRAQLASQRESLVERITDQAELMWFRQALNGKSEPKPRRRLNGRANGSLPH